MYDEEYIYKIFENHEDLMDTLPKKGINLLNQFLQKYDIFQQLLLPTHTDFNNLDLRGPYAEIDGNCL